MNFEMVLLGCLVLAFGFVRRYWIWERRVILVVLSLIIFAFVVGRGRLRIYLAQPAGCAQPCRSLAGGCSAISLALDLKDVSVRVNKYPQVWYRAMLRNTSCEALAAIPTDFFQQQEYFFVSQYSQDDMYFRFWGPDNTELTPAKGEFRSDGTIHISSGPAAASLVWASQATQSTWTPPTKEDYKNQQTQPWETSKGESTKGSTRFRPYVGEKPTNVQPYIVDGSAYPAIFGKMDENGFIKLEPGEMLISQPYKYWPHRFEMVEIETQKFIGTGYKAVEVKTPRPIAPTPPSGYRLLAQPVFRRPGLYHIQVAFNGRVSAKPHFRFEYRRTWFEKLVYMLGLRLGVLPDQNSEIFRIQAASNLVEVRVTP